ncbi:MAG: hypothetical protein ACE5FI_15160 [Anaerolineales bacterium]
MLKQFWNNWKRFGKWMGDQVARVILTALYFTVALPFGLGARLGSDRLGLQSAPSWTPKEQAEPTLDNAGSLF